MSKTQRLQMIDKFHQKLSIAAQCRILHVHRSCLYYKAAGESQYNMQIMHEIDKHYTHNNCLGVLKMRDMLRIDGFDVGAKRVRRLMRKMSLMPIYQKPRTTIPHPEHEKFPYLLGDVEINRVNQVWAADITYIPMKKGYLYLVAIIDWHSRQILSWRLSSIMDSHFCISALEEAISKFGIPEIFNTDQGSQFSSNLFTTILINNGVKISMDGKGRWRDNRIIERFWRSLKYECVYLCVFEDGQEAREQIGKWISYYNDQRPHNSLNGQTPSMCYNAGIRDAA